MLRPELSPAEYEGAANVMEWISWVLRRHSGCPDSILLPGSCDRKITLPPDASTSGGGGACGCRLHLCGSERLQQGPGQQRIRAEAARRGEPPPLILRPATQKLARHAADRLAGEDPDSLHRQ